MSQDVLARKYRPSKFTEVIGQNHVLQSIKTILEKNISHQAYIFSGTRGVENNTCKIDSKIIALPRTK